MEQFAKQIGDIFLAYGLIGAIAFIEGIAVYKLYQRNQELNETLFNVGTKAVESQAAVTSALNAMRDLLLKR